MHSICRRLTVVLSLAIGIALLASGTAAAFEVGLQDPGFLDPAGSSTSKTAFAALQAVHGSTIRLNVYWQGVAPAGAASPSGFNGANPGDPHYDWATVDNAVRAAAAHHDQVIGDLVGAPAWAQGPNRPASLKIFGGYWDPNPGEFGAFAHAAAVRYSGHFTPAGQPSPLPRVSLWEIYNEENLPEHLSAPNLVSEYRSLLSVGYRALKAVDRRDVVSMGGLAPVGFIKKYSIKPLKFAAEILCLKRVGQNFVRAPHCSARPRFDVLSIHPYSLDATPTKHAYSYDDILVGDMGKLVALLRAARRLNHLNVKLWADEWSWFSNPPNRQVGDAPMTAARYTAYSMYEMWRAGVSLVIWFQARDPQRPPADSPSFINGGGLYTSTGRPKPMLRAFSFPVVSTAGHGGVTVWGRAPVSRRTAIVIEQNLRGGWRSVAHSRTAPDGTFDVDLRGAASGTFRARVAGGATSLGYNSATIPAARTH